MQRLAFLLLLLLGFSTPTHAQFLRGYGIKAGLTSSSLRSPDLDLGGEQPISFDTKRRTGLAVLAYAEWLQAPIFSVVTEGGYIQRGYATEHEARDASNNRTGTIRNETRFDYLSFAALGKARLSVGMITPYAVGGPHLDVFLGGDPENGLTSSYSPTALGGTFGIGAETSAILPVAVFGELRYSFDLTNSLPDVPRDAYNNAFEFFVGVRL